jgi:hypothetical protein
MMLTDPAERVRKAAGAALAGLTSEKGFAALARFLSENPEERDSVIDGIRSAGGTAVARCILDSRDLLEAKTAGRLLSDGIDPVGVELLADGIEDENRIQEILRHAGAAAGESIVKAWPQIAEGAKKRLLPAVSVTGWAEWIVRSAGFSRKAAAEAIAAAGSLNDEERRGLFEPLLGTSGGRDRRMIRRIMKS